MNEKIENKKEKSTEVYRELLTGIKDLSAKGTEAEITKNINGLVEAIISALSGGDVKTALMLDASRSYDKEDYIFTHSLNVCLVAVVIGIKKKFDKRQLKDLALLGLVHAKDHINVPQNLLEWAAPDNEMDEIVKISDIYDAMTHPPSYRHEMTSADTIASIMDACDLFDSPLVKPLLNELGFYPEGSWVALNTREIGKVIAVNKDTPLRPVVELITGRQGTLDLSKNMLVYIEKGLTEDEVKALRKKA
ncbi:HD-GYP domain-containing protein [Candidatus Omnitrophota bacterium]